MLTLCFSTFPIISLDSKPTMVCSVTLFLCLLGVTSSLAEMTVVDMTFDLGDDTIYWPGNPAFKFTIIARGNPVSYTHLTLPTRMVV